MKRTIPLVDLTDDSQVTKKIGSHRQKCTVLRKRGLTRRRHLSLDGKVTDTVLPVRVVPISTSTDQEQVVV